MKRIALAHVHDLEHRIADMTAMKHTLQALVDCCQGDDRPGCPILDDLEAAPASSPGSSHGTPSRGIIRSGR